MKLLRRVVIALLVLTCLAAPALAEGSGTSATASKPKKKKELRVKVVENQLFKMEKDIVTIKGQIEVTHGEARITASEITYDSKRQFAVITGSPRLAQNEITITGDKFSAWFNEDKLVVEGHVVLGRRETGKAGAASGTAPERLSLTAERMEYNTDKRILTATGETVSAREKDRTATAKEARYDDNTELLVLSGDVIVKEKDDKTLRGGRVSIDIDKNTVGVEGPVEVEFILKDEAKPAEGQPAAEPAEQPAGKAAGQ